MTASSDPGLPGRILVTNRSHPQALGDAIAALPALAALGRAGRLSEVCWTCAQMADSGGPVWDLPGVRQTVLAPDVQWSGPVLETQSVVFQIGQGRADLSLPRLYALALGLDSSQVLPYPEIQGPPVPIPSGLPVSSVLDDSAVLLCPASNSDLGTGTKIWPMPRWQALSLRLAAEGQSPLFWPQAGQGLPSLRQTIAAFFAVEAVISIDNGLGWLAQALAVPHVQILSSNMPQAYAWDPGQRARNLSDCRTVSVWQVAEALGQVLADQPSSADS